MMALRRALRSLWMTPGFSLVAIVALALGIGANTAIYSLVQAIFLKPLPYADSGNIVQLTSSIPERNFNGVGFSWPRWLAVQERQQAFSEMAIAAQTGFTLTERGDPEQLGGMQISHNYFPLLGVAPALGRNFLPEEDRPGAEKVAILSDGIWQRKFAGDPSAIGQVISLDGQPHTVIGVMPASLSSFPLNQTAVFTARPTEVSYLVREQIDGGGFFFNVLARLKAGVSLQEAHEQLSVIAAAYAQAYPSNVDADASADVAYLLDSLVGNQRQTYGVLFAAVACVLLIACANVANLVLARYAGRRKQIAIRFALGAKRRHIISELVAENVVLALLGGLLGMALAASTIGVIVQLGENFIPRAAEVSLDPTVMLFTLGVSLLTGLALGLVSALQVAQPELTGALKDSSRNATASKRQNRVRASLMVTEVAVSFVLLIAASLLINSFMRVQQVEPGFRSDGIFAGALQIPTTKYAVMSEELANFYGALLQELKAIPGAAVVAFNDSPPLSGFAGGSPFAVVGQAIPPPREQPLALRHVISPNSFQTLEIPLLKGRDFDDRDTPSSKPVVIINETFAKQAFPDSDPIGKQIVSGMLQLTQEVVGVVADTHSQDLTTPPTAEMYYSALQRPEGFSNILIRTEGDPLNLTASVRAAINRVDPTVPLTNVTTMDAMVEQSTADRRLLMAMLAAFAGLALVLASLGVYSVMAYSVGQRSGEIGVRMAMGAAASRVSQMVVSQGLRLTAIGLGLGLVVSLVLTRLMNALLYGVGASDPWTYLGITALLLVVTFIACWIPAQRAARVDPLVALRSE